MGQVVQGQVKLTRGDLAAHGTVLSVAGPLLLGQQSFVPSLSLPRMDVFGFSLHHMDLDAVQAFQEGTVPKFLG